MGFAEVIIHEVGRNRSMKVFHFLDLLWSDPNVDKYFIARAACGDVPPPIAATETLRVTTLTYNFAGRLAQMNSPEGYINYEYSPATGRLTKTCTTNSTVEYDYDSLGRLWKVNALKRNSTNLSSAETIIYNYNAVGSRAGVKLPNSSLTNTSYAYDDLNRLVGLTNLASDGSLLSQFNYQVDSTGRRTNATEVIGIPSDEGGGWQTNILSWAYDQMYRLTNEVCKSTASGGSYTNSFQYDKAGNRWQQVRYRSTGTITITNQYNANDQLLKEVTLDGLGAPTTTNLYAYDANGSLVASTNSASTNLFSYDLKNKLNSVASKVGAFWTTNRFQYNDQGIRVRKIDVSSSTHYLVDANNHTGYAQVLEEFSVSGSSKTLTRSYVIGDDVLGQCSSSDTHDPRWLLYDGHGSTRQLADRVGSAITCRYNFEAYGEKLTDTSTSIQKTDLLYCGEQHDTTINMYNLRARFYDPSNGRFNAMDSFMGYNNDPQSLHKYAYCHGDPLNGFDPSGEVFLLSTLFSWWMRAHWIVRVLSVVLVVIYVTKYLAARFGGRALEPDERERIRTALKVLDRPELNGQYDFAKRVDRSLTQLSAPVRVYPDSQLLDNPKYKDRWAQTNMPFDILDLSESTLQLDPRLLAAVLVHEAVHMGQIYARERPAWQKQADFLRDLGITQQYLDQHPNEFTSPIDQKFLRNCRQGFYERNVNNRPFL